jgi:hypothetical protein
VAAAPISRTLPAVRRPGVPARSSFPSPPRPPSKRPTGVVIGLPPELDRRRFRRRRHVVREEPRVRRRAGTVDRGPLAEHGLQIRAMSVATRISTDSCELVERVTGTISRRRREAYSVVLRREILISIMERMVQDVARAHGREYSFTEIPRLQFAVVGRSILCAGDEINNKCDA